MRAPDDYAHTLLDENVPTLPEILRELDRSQTEADAAKVEALRATEAHTTVSNALTLIVSQLPLDPADEAARQKLIDATATSQSVAASVEAFLKGVLRRYPAGSNAYESLASVGIDQHLMPQDFLALPRPIQQRLVAAGNYYPMAHQSKLDFGPAALALISALEWLVRENIILPIIKRMAADGTPRKGNKEVTLGSVPYMFGTARDSKPKEAAPYLTALAALFPEHRQFLGETLPRGLETPIKLRNDWAHGHGTVHLEDFENLIEILFSHPALLVKAARIAATAS